MSAKGNTTAWITFLLSLLVLSLAATSYWHLADQLLIGIRLSIVLLLSVLVVRAKWRERHSSDCSPSSSDRGDSLARQIRRWMHGE